MGFKQNTAEHASATSGNDLAARRTFISFGVFELDIDSRELRKQGVKVRLQEQPFQILQVLLEHPGRVVTREELQQRIWPSDTFVDFDRGVYNAIKKLREALGDSADTPRYVETLSRRGYRFVAAVNGNGSGSATTEAAPHPAARPAADTRLRIGIGLSMVAAVVFAALFGLSRVWHQTPGQSTAPQIRSIAVLPLQNLSADPAQEYFSDGMTDALITDLAQISSIRVISRTSSMQYKLTHKSLPEIARELNVDGIVEGTVQHSGDRVRITAQLIQGLADKHLWANSYEEDVRDVFALERTVTEDIARQVRARLMTSSQVQAIQPRRVNPDVLETYLKGTYYCDKSDCSNDKTFRKAKEYFQQAIDRDPQFAPPYVEMANLYTNMKWGSSENWDIAEKLAKKAVELEPTSADAHELLSDIAFHRHWDWATAEREVRTSVLLNPNSAESHGSLCWLLTRLGRLDEALKECEIAQELDPNHDHMFDILYFRRECDRRIPLLKRWIDLYPNEFVEHEELAHCYWMKGLLKEAEEEAERAWVLFGSKEMASRIHQGFATSGLEGSLQAAAAGLEHLAANNEGFYPMNAADIYVQLGNKDRAFYWLEQAYKHPDMANVYEGLVNLKVDPMLHPLRSDPRYKDLLRRVGLPP